MVFLLELRIGAYTYRVATSSIEVPRTDGTTIWYDVGLVGVDWSRVFRLDTDAPANDIPVEVAPGVLDVAALIREGVNLYQATAEVARLLDGQTYEQREILVDGRVSELTYDDPAEPVSFAVLAAEYNASAYVPGPDAVLVGSTANSNAAVVPIVFGAPAYTPVGIVGDAYLVGAGSPAHAAEVPTLNSSFAICSDSVHASYVYVAYDVAREDRLWSVHSVTEDVPVENSENVHSYINLLSTLLAHDPSYPSGDDQARMTRALVCWAGYGVWRATVREPVRTAGDLIEYLLWRGGNVDRGRTAAAVDHLPIEVDGYIDERCDPIEWITSNLSSILPVSIVTGPRGAYPVVARPYLDPTIQGPELSVERREIYPDAPIVYSPLDDIRNDIEVRYAIDAGSRSYGQSVRHTGDQSVTSGDYVSRSQLATVSRGIYGERTHVVETTCLHRLASAHQVAAWMIRRYALPDRSTSYVIDNRVTLDRTLAAIEPGGPVTISDPDRGITGLCVVEGIRANLDGTHTIDIRTVETA